MKVLLQLIPNLREAIPVPTQAHLFSLAKAEPFRDAYSLRYLVGERLSMLQDISSDSVELVEGFDDLLDAGRDRDTLSLLGCHGSSLVHLVGLTL